MSKNVINTELMLEVYEGKDLGLTYSVEYSVFKVWAPTAFAVSLVLYETDGNQRNIGFDPSSTDSGRIIYMQRQNGGVWQTKLSGDLKGNIICTVLYLLMEM